MFWTWNSSYGMVQNRANSPLSNSANSQSKEFHIPARVLERIGGYRSIFFPAGQLINSINTGDTSHLIIGADTITWFNRFTIAKIADQAICASQEAPRKKFADNYATMFKVTAISN